MSERTWLAWTWQVRYQGHRFSYAAIRRPLKAVHEFRSSEEREE